VAVLKRAVKTLRETVYHEVEVLTLFLTENTLCFASRKMVLKKAREKSRLMQKIRDISEDEMVAIYSQTEFYSSRFQKEIAAHLQKEGIDPHLLQAPDWQDEQENATRRTFLGAYRGYGRNEGYFQGFPTDVCWERAHISRQELERVRYIEYDYWVELSGGTRLAIDGARNAVAGKVVFRVPSSGLLDMANELRQGAQFPPLILVAKDVDGYLVVMEGHMRLTAYLIAPEYIPPQLEVLVGYSQHLTDWGCY
jgi:hypothetical protein